MATLDILIYPDDRLRKVAKPVDAVDGDVAALVDDMFETMYEAPGIGLAATQVNVHRRVVGDGFRAGRRVQRRRFTPDHFHPAVDAHCSRHATP